MLQEVTGIEDLGVFKSPGQPNINITVDRDKISRYGLNVSDVQDVIETAVGGKVASQVSGRREALRYAWSVTSRSTGATSNAIRRIPVLTPDGYRIPIEELADVKIEDGASTIYREENQRYIAVKFSVRGRDLGSTIEEAQNKVTPRFCCPRLQYRLGQESLKASAAPSAG